MKTVGELKEKLAAWSDDTPIMMASDYEGDRFYALASVGSGTVDPTEPTYLIDEEDLAMYPEQYGEGYVKCIVLWPR